MTRDGVCEPRVRGKEEGKTEVNLKGQERDKKGRERGTRDR